MLLHVPPGENRKLCNNNPCGGNPRLYPRLPMTAAQIVLNTFVPAIKWKTTVRRSLTMCPRRNLSSNR